MPAEKGAPIRDHEERVRPGQPRRGQRNEEDDEEDADDYSDVSGIDEEEEDEDEPDEIPRDPYPNDFFNFGQSLTVKGKLQSIALVHTYIQRV